MKIRVSELRKIIREELAEMKLGLASAPRGMIGLGAGHAAEPLGDSTEDIIDFQRDSEADEYDDFMLGKRGKYPPVPFKLNLR